MASSSRSLPRQGNVSSHGILPTWVPFRTTVFSEEKLVFSLYLMEGKQGGLSGGIGEGSWQGEAFTPDCVLQRTGALRRGPPPSSWETQPTCRPKSTLAATCHCDCSWTTVWPPRRQIGMPPLITPSWTSMGEGWAASLGNPQTMTYAAFFNL